MMEKPFLSIPDMPFCIGAGPLPANPEPLPSIFPMELSLNEHLGRLEQSGSAALEGLLKAAYALGFEMGTPSDNTDMGKPYVTDFVGFIDNFTDGKGRALEIGAGVGYLSRVLSDKGWRVDSIEPGKGYEGHWERHGVKVLNEFFPSPAAKGPYDLIVFYTVLEHVKDTRTFLKTVAEHLTPGGKIILSVPDCTLEIDTGDPSILLHEHFHYFNSGSLVRTLMEAGFASIVKSSSFGRSLYACGVMDGTVEPLRPVEADLAPLRVFAEKVLLLKSNFREMLAAQSARGTVGVYCPGRALALLPGTHGARFFDDSPALHGKYYPPFTSRIESREDLIKDPPEALFIMSRTFGERLFRDLGPLLPGTRIFLPHEILDAG